MCLLAIILFEIGIGAAGFIKHKDLEGIVNNGFNKTLTHYEDNKLAWQLLQTEVSQLSNGVGVACFLENNVFINFVSITVHLLRCQRPRRLGECSVIEQHIAERVL